MLAIGCGNSEVVPDADLRDAAAVDTNQDAFVAPNVDAGGELDAFGGSDAFAGDDAFALDAFAESDAFAELDAHAEPDAFAEPDAYAPDAYVAPDAAPPCVARTEFCGLPADEDCDGNVDEGCGPCTVGQVTCAAGCCAVPETTLSTNGTYPDIDVDAMGNVYVLYSVPGGLWQTHLQRYDAATSRWTDREVGTSEGGYRSTLRLDAEGGVHVLSGRNFGALRYRYSTNGGVTWRTTTLVTMRQSSGGVSDFVVAPDGTIHIVFMEDTTIETPDALIYAHGPRGGALTRERLDVDTHAPGHPRIDLDSSGRPWVLFEADGPDGRATTSVRVMHHDGGAWRYEDIQEGTSLGLGRGREFCNRELIDVTGVDEARVLYSRGVVPELVLAQRSALGVWTTRIVPADPSATFDTEEAELVYVANGLRSHAGSPLRTYTSTTQLGGTAALRRVGNELYVAYGSRTTPGSLMFARLPLP